MGKTWEITYLSTYTNRVTKRETVTMPEAQAFRHAQANLLARGWKAEIRPASK